MKADTKINYFFILTFIAGVIVGAMIFSSCTKIPDSAKDTTTSNVSISLDYTFPSRSGDMAAKDGSTYLDFYNQYIFFYILNTFVYNPL